MNAVVTNRHVSTTHNERYYHLTREVKRTITRQDKSTGKSYPEEITETVGYATIFFRQRDPRLVSNPDTGWAASVALCDARDHFAKTIGRNVARRKWFNGNTVVFDGAPSHELAVKLADAAMARRAATRRNG